MERAILLLHSTVGFLYEQWTYSYDLQNEENKLITNQNQLLHAHTHTLKHSHTQRLIDGRCLQRFSEWNISEISDDSCIFTQMSWNTHTHTNTHSCILLLNELIQREKKLCCDPEKEIILSSAPPLNIYTGKTVQHTLLKYHRSVKSNTRPI